MTVVTINGKVSIGSGARSSFLVSTKHLIKNNRCTIVIFLFFFLLRVRSSSRGTACATSTTSSFSSLSCPLNSSCMPSSCSALSKLSYSFPACCRDVIRALSFINADKNDIWSSYFNFCVLPVACPLFVSSLMC